MGAILTDQSMASLEILAAEFELTAKALRIRLRSLPLLNDLDPSKPDEQEPIEQGRKLMSSLFRTFRSQLDVQWSVILDEIIAELEAQRAPAEEG